MSDNQNNRNLNRWHKCRSRNWRVAFFILKYSFFNFDSIGWSKRDNDANSLFNIFLFLSSSLAINWNPLSAIWAEHARSKSKQVAVMVESIQRLILADCCFHGVNKLRLARSLKKIQLKNNNPKMHPMEFRIMIRTTFDKSQMFLQMLQKVSQRIP